MEKRRLKYTAFALNIVFVFCCQIAWSQNPSDIIEDILFSKEGFCERIPQRTNNYLIKIDSLIYHSNDNINYHKLKTIIQEFQSKCEECKFYGTYDNSDVGFVVHNGQERILDMLITGYHFVKFCDENREIESAYKKIRDLTLMDRKQRFSQYQKFGKYDEPNYNWIGKYFKMYAKDLDPYVAADFKKLRNGYYSQEETRALFRSFVFKYYNFSELNILRLTNDEVMKSEVLFERYNLTYNFIIWVLKMNSLESQELIWKLVEQRKHLKTIRQFYYRLDIEPVTCLNSTQKKIVRFLLYYCDE